MRRILNLLESIDNTIFKNALELLNDIINSNYNSFLDQYKDYNEYDEDIDDRVLANSVEFIDWLTKELMDKIQDAYYNINYHIKGDHIIGYRMITAPQDWKPDNTKHPGIYWSWDEHAAEAHWGNYNPDYTEWLITAKIPLSSIDWPITLAQNASPNYEDEKEIRIFENAPIEILGCEEK